MADSDSEFDEPLKVGGHRSEILAASQPAKAAEQDVGFQEPDRSHLGTDSGLSERIRTDVQRSERRILAALEEGGAARHDEMTYLYNEIMQLKKDLGGSKRIATFAYFLLVFFVVAMVYLIQNPTIVGGMIQWVLELMP